MTGSNPPTREEFSRLRAQVIDLQQLVVALQADLLRAEQTVVLGSEPDPALQWEWEVDGFGDDLPLTLYGYTPDDEGVVFAWITPVPEGIGAALHFVDVFGSTLYRTVSDAQEAADRRYLETAG